MITFQDRYPNLKYDDAVETGAREPDMATKEQEYDNEFRNEHCIKFIYPNRMQIRYFVYWTKVICFSIMLVK